MKTTIFKVAAGILLAGVTIVLVKNYWPNAQNENGTQKGFNPAFASYIEEATLGIISIESPIMVRFTRDVKDSIFSETPEANNYFTFSPSISGSSFWVDSRTLEFRPEKHLPYGTEFSATLALDELMEISDPALEDFPFSFKTRDLAIELETQGISYYDESTNTKLKIEGSLLCSDKVDNNLLEKTLTANQNGSSLSITWNHVTDQNVHNFVIENVDRTKTEGKVTMNLNGGPFNIDLEKEQIVVIPAIGNFTFLSGTVVQTPDQFISLRFSDQIITKESIEGMVTVKSTDCDIEVNGNEIKLIPTVRQTGSKVVSISQYLKNKDGVQLGADYSYTAVFEQAKPEVRWVGEGNILPYNEGAKIPFEAVGLKSVNVSIVKIYESNVYQFFQINQINGSREIVRVGRPVVEKEISLIESGVANLQKWNRYFIDLSSLVDAEPGAIYQVNIGFKRSQSTYECSETFEDEENQGNTRNWDNTEYQESSYWDYYEDYDYYYDYDYSQRDNPCSPSYYSNNRSISKNVFVSDMGIIAKKGNNKNYSFAITDLKTTNPIQGVTISFYSYQQKLLETLTTDGEGMASLVVKTKEIPYLLVAQYNNQKGYLRLDNSSALSLSHFNTSGTVSEEGYKGFIYGERGVWRPGDSVYLSFILEDKLKRLPKDFPVSLDLSDPNGKSVRKITRTTSKSGIYDFRTSTLPESPTGNWMATVRVGNSRFTKTIPIETIKPNRLKIEIDFKNDEIHAGDKTVEGVLKSRWLHGATASNLKAKVEAVLTPTRTSFEKYTDYQFDDESRKFVGEAVTIFEGTLDEEGTAEIKTELNMNGFAPGKLLAKIKTEVFEHSGNSSVDRFSIVYNQYTRYVGLKTPKGDRRGMILTDTNQIVDLVMVNEEGKPVPGTQQVDVELYKLNWRWWWDNSFEGVSNYVGSRYNTPILKSSATITNGKGNYVLKVNRPEWGRYYIRVCDPVSGHCSGKIIYIDWPGWAGKPAGEMNGVSVLDFNSDKESYNTGDVATIKIPSSPAGRALVSIENGSSILKQFWVKTEKGSTNFNFNVTEDMTPNVFVHISQIQAHGVARNDLPLRLYGIINIGIENKETHLNPVITMPEVLKPEQVFEVKVSESSGKSMSYTLAVVDEGLLDLTRFPTPDPWRHFYSKEALGVRTFDMYDDVIGAYSTEYERILGLGGDLELKNQDGDNLNRFKPCVKFLGPFKLEKGKKATHKISMPYYVGSVRVMVVAAHEGNYGQSEKAVPVRQPVMVLGTLPRVLGPSEELTLPVSVFAMESQIKSVVVSVESNDLVEVIGSKSQTVQFKKIGEQMAYFKLKVRDKVGAAKIKIAGKSGSELASDVIDILVRNSNPVVTNVQSAILASKGKLTLNLKAVGMDGTNSGALEVSSILPINLEKRLNYLIQYPHGCIEQTVSSVFPQLYLSDLTEIDRNTEDRIRYNIASGIQRILGFQTSDGGFSYWPGEAAPSEWGSNYAGHFLLEAQRKGFAVPEQVLKNWKKFQKNQAQNYRGGTSESRYGQGLIQAYRLYTLALNNSPEIGAMNRLKSESYLGYTAKWQLAATYQLIGQPEMAKSLINNTNTSLGDYSDYSYNYGSALRDKAIILESLIELKDFVRSTEVLKEIAKEFETESWFSTQTTAYCLLAISKFASINKSKSPINFDFIIGTNKNRNAHTELAMSVIKLSEKDIKSGKLELSNLGDANLFVRIITQGKPAIGDSNDVFSNLQMNISYTDMKGKAIDVGALVQGTDFIAQVTIKHPGLRSSYQDLALTEIFPSGWEITNTRMDGTESFYASSQYRYQDIRDDRVLTYFDLHPRNEVTYKVFLHAAYVGKFYKPTVSCEAMYDYTTNARVHGGWIRVTESTMP